MEKWKPLRASHFSTPPTAAELLTRPLRYTNNLAGTKDRAEHFNTTFAEDPGTYLFVTKAWDQSGRDFVADRTVTVYDGTPGAVCPAAEDSANLCLPSGDTA